MGITATDMFTCAQDSIQAHMKVVKSCGAGVCVFLLVLHTSRGVGFCSALSR
jgi:hypothetical protein